MAFRALTETGPEWNYGPFISWDFRWSSRFSPGILGGIQDLHGVETMVMCPPPLYGIDRP